MIYDAYYHNDLDGRASTAVVLDFLRARGDTIKNFVPVDYSIGPKWEKLKFKNPAIIVDFLYHPRAAIWFDHHITSFRKDVWKKKFKPTKLKRWDISYPSACHLAMDSLVKSFGYKPPKHIRELAKWLDIVDGALFTSAKQTIEMKEPAIALDVFIDHFSKPMKPLSWLVKLMAEKPLREVVRDPRVRKGIAEVRRDRKKSLAFYTKNLLYENRVAYVDISKEKVEELRFAPFYLEPKARYAVTVKPRSYGYHVTVGVNPWRKYESRVNIAHLLKIYGGGGHKDVGGVDFRSRTVLDRAVKEIFAKLAKA